MNTKVSVSTLFNGLVVLTAVLCSSCESDHHGYQVVGERSDLTLLGPDTIVFTELGQSVHLPYKVVDKQGNEVSAPPISFPSLKGSYTLGNDSLTINYSVFENKAFNQSVNAACYMEQGMVTKPVYLAFRPDLSKSTPEHPHIFVKTPGTLESYIDPAQEKNITGLTLYGLLNTVDQIYLRKLLGAPETFDAWGEEVGMDILDPGNNWVLLPKDDDFFAKIKSQYKLSFLDLRNVVYKSVDEPEDAFFFLDYKVTDQYVKPLNMVRFLFYCCSNLKEIYLPYWYQGINSCVFDMSGRLETVHYPDQLEEYAREITTARHFNDFSYCPQIQTFDLGSQTTKYKVDEEGSLWEVECNGLLICAKNPNRTRFDVPVGSTMFTYSLGSYTQLTDIYIHETKPSIYNDLTDRYGNLTNLVTSQMIEEHMTFHVPQGYLEEFKKRCHYEIWPDLKLIDDVTDYVVSETAPSKADLRSTEPVQHRRYRIIHAYE